MPTFYDENPEASLLLGDVVVGFQSIVPQIHKPGPPGEAIELAILVRRPDYFVVMTPCCSVAKGSITLAPLIPIRGNFLTNDYFAEDLTRINRPAPGEKWVPEAELAKMTAAQRQALAERGLVFGITDCFVYAETALLRRYDVKIPARGTSEMRNTGFYMVEFGSAFRLECNQVQRNKPAPTGTKHLQLAVSTRQELRQKLCEYFGRVPEEDRRTLESAEV